MAQLMNGKAISEAVRKQIKQEIDALQEEQGITPGLAVVLVGEDSASEVYVKNKEKACEEVGISFELFRLSASITQQELEETICSLNDREDIDGILLQLPLPGKLNSDPVVSLIRPDKDVDAFHPENIGHIMRGDFIYLPCTPAGIMQMLREAGINPSGKRCVVVGRSDIVGKPMAMLLLHADATVTICHSKTENLAQICREADILVSAVGKAGFITSDMVCPGAVVIDVGMNRNAEGKLCGDVDFASVEPIASYITPVPGGVGPMTVAMLLQNTLEAAKRHGGITV
ncbi:MAG: bifunctional methylenetetrahydrofolate dehydrogenase/methenyltetrahydrofolate cyclohydrolase FolD [Clostridium sp.]|uniref:bifunctional methylenetetrahydrofolate dehydrogenase/methenyltetrahydrofolate cyclohydrolase FolD n=1 Tax=Clostridium sp. TaxID=1506 RepID=UPI002914A2F9|nr:bifunctional methylenetetrahydrofolate dehydrogenase/methenyltetrahydrofolate cyclohydrolase FolD [Clostridium sp.]MDU7337182.1 bifunctional methylenetetrahydrofolate dehydrogenase/methenyltetrahydrofolate cyclohydrolase FolD [Clostridium sp.]